MTAETEGAVGVEAVVTLNDGHETFLDLLLREAIVGHLTLHEMATLTYLVVIAHEGLSDASDQGQDRRDGSHLCVPTSQARRDDVCLRVAFHTHLVGGRRGERSTTEGANRLEHETVLQQDDIATRQGLDLDPDRDPGGLAGMTVDATARRPDPTRNVIIRSLVRGHRGHRVGAQLRRNMMQS